MSTRKGNVVFMTDILSKAMELALQIINEKNPELNDKEKVARQVGVGAIIFNDLLGDRVKNVDFDWERVLDFEGDSGPYVQYTSVRCQSILRKQTGDIPNRPPALMAMTEEQKLIFSLLRFPEVLEAGFKQFKPNILAQYLLELCAHFNQFYHHCRILGMDPEVQDSRLCLVAATGKILEQGLKILNIEAPEAM